MPSGEISLELWNIVEIKIGESNTRHFVGYCVEDRQGRVSTPILTFDKDKGVGTTRSGSKYQLVGEPGHVHPDGLYVFEVTTLNYPIEYTWVFPVVDPNSKVNADA